GSSDEELLSSMVVGLRQKVKVFEQRILSNSLRPTLPRNELELSNAAVSFEVELLAGVAGAKGKRCDALVGIEDYWQRCQDAEGVYRYSDLPEQRFQRQRRFEAVRSDIETHQAGRDVCRP